MTGIVAKVRIADGGDGELAALYEWLQGEDELRGRIRAVRGPIGETELGPATELLTVALGGWRCGYCSRIVPEDLAADPQDYGEDRRGVGRAICHRGRPECWRRSTAGRADP